MPQSARKLEQNPSAQSSAASNIRVARMADFKSIIELYYKFDQYHYSLRPSYYKKPKKPARSRQFVLNALLNPLERLFLYEKNGDVIGLMHLRVNPAYVMEAIISERTLSMLEISVIDPDQNPEVSAALQVAMTEFGLQSGCARIIGDVDNDNIRSRKFLEKNGGYPVSIRYHKDLEHSDEITKHDTSLVGSLERKWARFKVSILALLWRP